MGGYYMYTPIFGELTLKNGMVKNLKHGALDKALDEVKVARKYIEEYENAVQALIRYLKDWFAVNPSTLPNKDRTLIAYYMNEVELQLVSVIMAILSKDPGCLTRSEGAGYLAQEGLFVCYVNSMLFISGGETDFLNSYFQKIFPKVLNLCRYYSEELSSLLKDTEWLHNIIKLRDSNLIRNLIAGEWKFPSFHTIQFYAQYKSDVDEVQKEVSSFLETRAGIENFIRNLDNSLTYRYQLREYYLSREPTMQKNATEDLLAFCSIQSEFLCEQEHTALLLEEMILPDDLRSEEMILLEKMKYECTDRNSSKRQLTLEWKW